MSQKITRLHIRNFKRVVAIDIDAEGKELIRVSGENGSGKSSTLDSIACAFLGQRHHPQDPIRHGQSEASIVAETETLVVTRSWSGKSGHRLKVKRKDGLPLDGSPQDELDRVCAGITFDPHTFSLLPAKEQVRMLRQVTGLDTTSLDAKRKQIYERRTGVNAEHRAMESQLAGIKLPPEPAPVPEEKNLVAITEKKVEAERTKAANERFRQDAQRALTAVELASKEVDRLRVLLAKAEDDYSSKARHYESLTDTAANLIDPDTSHIDAEIAAARAHNAHVRELQTLLEQYASRQQQSERLRKLAAAKKDASDDLTRQLEDIDAEKARMLAAAKLPLPGMTIDNDEIRVNGSPFEQCSDAEKIRMGLEIYAGLNPELRVARIKNGSLLSKKSMAVLAEWVKEKDFQVWIEICQECEDGITISDGTVVSHEEEPAMADDDCAVRA